MCYDEKQNAFPIRSGTIQGCLLSLLLFSALKILASAFRQENEYNGRKRWNYFYLQPWSHNRGEETSTCGTPSCFHKSSFTGAQLCSLIYVLSMAALILQWKSWLAATETGLPQILEYLLSLIRAYFEKEKVWQPLVYGENLIQSTKKELRRKQRSI